MSTVPARVAENAAHAHAIVAGVTGEESANAVARARWLAREIVASLYVVRLDPNARRAAQAAALAAAAEDARAALVVVGGRPSRIGKSLAEQVHDETRSPVLHVRNPVRMHYRAVVVAVSATSNPSAMVTAARIAAPTASRLDYLHLLETPYEPMLIGQGAGLVDIREYRAEAETDARERLAKRFADAGLAIEARALSLEVGNPRELVDRVPSRALLVLQRGRSWMRHFVFGSVTRAVIRGHGPDVLVV